MRHFFYAVYILFYSGAVFMAGMFVGQRLERGKIARGKAPLSAVAVSESLRDSKAVVNISQRKASAAGKGE